MSVPYLIFTCSACDYGESSFVAVGHFVWVSDGKICNFFPKIGICNDCSQIVAIEGIPDRSTFLRARELHPSLKGKFQVFTERKRDDAKWLAFQNDFDILEQVMAQNRLPVCLQCGSENTSGLKLPETYGGGLTNIPKTPLGVYHPNCGGEFFVEGSGRTRMGVVSKTHYFDLRGKYLTTLYGS